MTTQGFLAEKCVSMGTNILGPLLNLNASVTCCVIADQASCLYPFSCSLGIVFVPDTSKCKYQSRLYYVRSLYLSQTVLYCKSMGGGGTNEVNKLKQVEAVFEKYPGM